MRKALVAIPGLDSLIKSIPRHITMLQCGRRTQQVYTQICQIAGAGKELNLPLQDYSCMATICSSHQNG